MSELAKKRILFVDDEPSILAGLRSVLYRDRTRWEMTFVAGSDEALIALQAARYDVVVSDMRMPGLDGANLLERVRQDFPNTGRIILSGTADKAEVDRAAASVDALLGKPCDTKTLRTTIEQLIARIVSY